MPGVGSAQPQQDTYSSWVGLMYVFNLIVGTGALTLPAVFTKAGWLLSLCLIVLLAFVSFITVTFIVETMACANATIQWRRIQSHKIDGENEATVDSDDHSDNGDDNDDDDDENDASVSTEETAIINNHRSRGRYYSINHKVELGEMAALYFSRIGRILFFVSLCVYLYGDLAIYAAAISKTLCDIVCSSASNNRTSDDFQVPCWQPEGTLTKANVYRIFVCAFAMTIGPFSYFNVQKTKYFQMATTTMRWCAFSIMITLATLRLFAHADHSQNDDDDVGHPALVNIHGVPALIGASVYSFMCHHSLPGLIAPFAEKQHVIRQIALDYALICGFYILLGLTGSFAFRDLYDLYTLNFMPNDSTSGAAMQLIRYFLGLFPVFTLSTSFPIIAITLQGNLRALFLDPNAMHRYSFTLRRLTFPTLAVVPPVLVALATHDLSSLVEFTGSYAGACIQYVIPACLVWSARKHCRRDIGSGALNKYRSPFSGAGWIGCVLLWCGACIILVTVNLFWDE